jgi:hypothetical protein
MFWGGSGAWPAGGKAAERQVAKQTQFLLSGVFSSVCGGFGGSSQSGGIFRFGRRTGLAGYAEYRIMPSNCGCGCGDTGRWLVLGVSRFDLLGIILGASHLRISESFGVWPAYDQGTKSADATNRPRSSAVSHRLTRSRTSGTPIRRLIMPSK